MGVTVAAFIFPRFSATVIPGTAITNARPLWAYRLSNVLRPANPPPPECAAQQETARFA
jgi:hypothetical protein